MQYVHIQIDITCVGISSRRHDPAEGSRTFQNFSLVYKLGSSLYVLTGLQRNKLFSVIPSQTNLRLTR